MVLKIGMLWNIGKWHNDIFLFAESQLVWRYYWCLSLDWLGYLVFLLWMRRHLYLITYSRFSTLFRLVVCLILCCNDNFLWICSLAMSLSREERFHAASTFETIFLCSAMPRYFFLTSRLLKPIQSNSASSIYYSLSAAIELFLLKRNWSDF